MKALIILCLCIIKFSALAAKKATSCFTPNILFSVQQSDIHMKYLAGNLTTNTTCKKRCLRKCFTFYRKGLLHITDCTVHSAALISHKTMCFMFCINIPFTLKKLPLLSRQRAFIVKDIFPGKTPLYALNS